MDSESKPLPELSSISPDLSLIAINLTRRCNLNCAHCYLDATTLKHGSLGELGCDEVCTLLKQVSDQRSGTMVVLTGGEPLLRQDIEEMVRYGSQLDLAMVVGTNGTMLTQKRVAALKQAGLLGAGISVDSLNPQHHDEFRGLSGSWQKTMNGIEQCRQQDLAFQIHFTVTSGNVGELDNVIDFSRDCGAKVLNIFFLICTGRGESITDLSPQAYQQVLENLIKAQSLYDDIIIRPRCAPQFKRVAYQLNPHSDLNRISGREADGCIAGLHYCRITPTGGVTPCPYIDKEVGNIRKDSFQSLWQHADLFEQLRQPKLNGNCGRCEFQKLCGGCRARPYASGSSLMDTDPLCLYQPPDVAVIEPLDPIDQAITWSSGARKRLERIPGFVRKLVKKRAETYVQELGESEVTGEHLSILSARRFGGSPPSKPGHVG